MKKQKIVIDKLMKQIEIISKEKDSQETLNNVYAKEINRLQQNDSKFFKDTEIYRHDNEKHVEKVKKLTEQITILEEENQELKNENEDLEEDYKELTRIQEKNEKLKERDEKNKEIIRELHENYQVTKLILNI